ncbi:hypothetical protein CRE_15379 [Caenorhabditis remanei]|uniref:Uncharacterized protein n=1 Tax=Caenorhabditis remanei TaxID=31234 RepID=E3MC10_CAERE|nr:hypothetical protein CRE_15379 [Caenorhabditis remanei]
MYHIGDGDAPRLDIENQIEGGIGMEFLPAEMIQIIVGPNQLNERHRFLRPEIRPEQIDDVYQPAMHRPVANYHIALHQNEPQDFVIGERPLDARERRALIRERRAARAARQQERQQEGQQEEHEHQEAQQEDPVAHDVPLGFRVPVPRAVNENRMLNMQLQMRQIDQLLENRASDSEEEEERRHVSRHESVDLMPVFVRRAYRNRAKKFQCPICHETIENKNFMEHLSPCAEEKNASYEEKEKAECMFKFSDYYFMEKIYALRERLELEYLDATLDPNRRVQMACELCDTLEEHKNGKCMDNNQEAAFKSAANQIVQQAISNCLDFFEYKKQIELQMITDEYTEERAKLDIILTEQKDKAFADEMVKNVVRGESFAKDRVIFNMNERKLEFSRSKQRFYMIMVEKQTTRIVKYITKTKGMDLLRTILEYRVENNMEELTEPRDSNFNKTRQRGLGFHRRPRFRQPGRFLPV